MYNVRFIKNWNGSALTPDSWSAVPLLYNGKEAENLQVEDQEITRDTDDNSLGKIVWINNELTRFDPEQFIGIDFFVSEPRDAKFDFLIDADEWLSNTFKENNEQEEINYSIYMDEDGNIISYEESHNGIDPMLGEGEWLNGSRIDSKETLIQQYSKHVVQIYNKLSDDEEVILYTGFVDKTKTVQDSFKISIECTDIVGIVKQFAEQLIIVIPGDSEEYDYKFSHDLYDDLIQKIEEFTNLNIIFNNSVNDYIITGGELTEMSSINISEIVLPEFSTELAVYDDAIFVSEDIEKDLLVNVDDAEIIVYKQYTYYYQEYGSGNMPTLYRYEKALFVWVIITNLTEFGYDVSTHYTTQFLLNTWTVNPYGYLSNNVIGNTNPLNSFEIAQNKGKYYFDDDGRIVMLYKVTNEVINKFRRITQDYYSTAIPMYTGQYNYLEILKIILYLNILCTYSNADGELMIKKKDNLYNDTDLYVSNSEILKDGYSEKGVERNEYILTDAFDNILWFDIDENPDAVENLHLLLLDEYVNIFVNKFPLEVSCKILRKTNSTNEYKNITIGTKLNMLNNLWIVNRCKLNTTGFYYDIDAYKIGGYGPGDELESYSLPFMLLTNIEHLNYAYNIYRINDGNESTAFVGEDYSTISSPTINWVVTDLLSAKITSYHVQCNSSYYLSDWIFQGKDVTGTWITLDTQTGLTGEYSTVFNIDNTEFYSEFRLTDLEVVRNGVEDYVVIREFNLFGRII